MQSVWDAKERANLADWLSQRAVEILSEGDREAKKNKSSLSKSEWIFTKVREEILAETVDDFCKEMSSKAEALWGAEAADEVKYQEDDIKSKLREALEQMPPPIPIDRDGWAIAPGRRAWAVVAGTMLGMALGSLIFGLCFNEGKTGILMGGPLFAWLTARYIDNDALEKWVNRACIAATGWFLWDRISNFFPHKIIRKMIPFSGKKDVSKTAVKITAQATPFIVKFLIKKGFDAESCKKTLRHIYENWLESVAVVGINIYEAKIVIPLSSSKAEQERNRLEEELKQEQESARKFRNKVGEFTAALLRADISTDQKRQDLIAELKGSAEVMGYSSPVEGFKIWKEEMRERFETFGIVRPGDEVEIVEQPVMKDGSVSKKGTVRKMRISK